MLDERILGEHFTAREFRCHCGCGLGFESMQPKLLRRLVAARGLGPVPFIITSSIRCPTHNAAVGGVGSSAHVTGWAVDIAANTGTRRYQILTAAQQAGFNRIGIAATFLHLDCDPQKPGHVIWTY